MKHGEIRWRLTTMFASTELLLLALNALVRVLMDSETPSPPTASRRRSVLRIGNTDDQRH